MRARSRLCEGRSGRPGAAISRAPLGTAATPRCGLRSRVQPAVSFLFPLSTPLRGDVASYYAARFNIGFSFDVRPGKHDVASVLQIE